MKTIFLVLAGITALVSIQFLSCGKKERSVAELRQQLTDQVDYFERYVTDSVQPLLNRPPEQQKLVAAFKALRAHYKKFEWAVEYYMPSIARFVNGAPLPEIEQPEVAVQEPHGLQVMEELILDDTIDYPALKHETVLLKSYCISIIDNIEAGGFTQEQLYDAIKKQVFRIITLGITGFDAPAVKTGLAEAAVSLSELTAITPFLEGQSDLNNKINAAVGYLNANPDFDSFNRMIFIKDYANPITRTLALQQKQAGITPIRLQGLLKTNAATLFDENIFDPYFQESDAADPKLSEKIILGKKLFYDNTLSVSKKRSCATCHKPELYFTDRLAKNAALDANKALLRNTPTLLNAALQTAMFYDLRSPSLEHQASDVISNKDEMHGDLEQAVQLLSTDTSYTQLFGNAYKAHVITKENILAAIASYVKSLIGLNSRFDEYMRGNNQAMNKEEIEGFNLFAGKAKCASCHFIPLFNGVVPPAFTKTESEVLGVPLAADGQKMDTDSGRYKIINVAPYLHAFKTTTVRNTGMTAPYMHSGVYKTLEEVVDFYDKGGGIGLGLQVYNQTLSDERLNLTPKEKQLLIAFIHTLTDKAPQY
ncbi:cytochrome c peroxidase [Niabella yanshanensis]|uniref:Cytochrome c peroxidase n=1 Tax=Niabella yanshanensis TaxID=577386 RepID=A0ABZ0W199_9BACT|nr:cytochrome c peroxidase [Niabella yanshanensis]WQD37043.1 cytochrome c peroxidase [Niabella yanshanensis]